LSIFNIDKEGHPKKHLPLNLAGNIAYFLVNVIIGLLLVPYYISTLGVAAYGIIPLATSLNGYVGLLTHSLNNSVSRYLAVELKKGNYESANKTYNTAFFGITGIIIFVLPIVFFISLFAPVLFNVPTGQGTEVIILFLGVNGALLLRSWASNFTVSLFAYNRLDLLNFVNIVNIIVQVLLIVIFFSFDTPSLSLVGIAYFIGGITASFFAIFFSKKINPYLKINIHNFDRSRLIKIASMTWWVVVIQIGTVLFTQTDLIVVNILFGSLAAGTYAIAYQWVILLRQISGVFSGVLTPVILNYYAHDKMDIVVNISKSSVKIMGLIMALPIGLICGCAPQLLTLWVGDQFIFLAPLMILLTFHIAFNSAVLPLLSIFIVMNKVKIPGIVTIVLGGLNIVLAIILSSMTGWGYYGVAVAVLICLTLKNIFFTPLYTAKILQAKMDLFVKPIIPGVAGTLGIALTSVIIINSIHGSLLFTLSVTGIIIGIIYATIIIRFALNKFERDILVSYLPKNLQRYIT